MRYMHTKLPWHNNKEVLSIDFHPSKIIGDWTVASGGNDKQVSMWRIHLDDHYVVKQSRIGNLGYHEGAVNIVRWSPCGLYLASADDVGNIIIWHQRNAVPPVKPANEPWVVFQEFRSHMMSIPNLSWSPFGLKLISVSYDKTAILWDVLKGEEEQTITRHFQKVLAVSWSPKNDNIVILFQDRIRIFSVEGLPKYDLNQGIVPISASHSLHEKVLNYFAENLDEMVGRRIEFSPDGSVIVIPSACLKSDNIDEGSQYASLVCTTSSTIPSVVLPHDLPSTCVRFCPNLFKLQKNGPVPYIDVPYRMIFSIIVGSNVLFYDTQIPKPFLIVPEHCNDPTVESTDMTWSKDNLVFCISSTDGFCTFLNFGKGELGEPYKREQVLTTEEPRVEKGHSLEDERENGVPSEVEAYYVESSEHENDDSFEDGEENREIEQDNAEPLGDEEDQSGYGEDEDNSEDDGDASENEKTNSDTENDTEDIAAGDENSDAGRDEEDFSGYEEDDEDSSEDGGDALEDEEDTTPDSENKTYNTESVTSDTKSLESTNIASAPEIARRLNILSNILRNFIEQKQGLKGAKTKHREEPSSSRERQGVEIIDLTLSDEPQQGLMEAKRKRMEEPSSFRKQQSVEIVDLTLSDEPKKDLKEAKRKRMEESSTARKRQCIKAIDLTVSEETDEDFFDKNPDYDQDTDYSGKSTEGT